MSDDQPQSHPRSRALADGAAPLTGTPAGPGAEAVLRTVPIVITRPTVILPGTHSDGDGQPFEVTVLTFIEAIAPHLGPFSDWSRKNTNEMRLHVDRFARMVKVRRGKEIYQPGARFACGLLREYAKRQDPHANVPRRYRHLIRPTPPPAPEAKLTTIENHLGE